MVNKNRFNNILKMYLPLQSTGTFAINFCRHLLIWIDIIFFCYIVIRDEIIEQSEGALVGIGVLPHIIPFIAYSTYSAFLYLIWWQEYNLHYRIGL
jgi:hypothetical protein